LRRYAEELDKARRELSGESWIGDSDIGPALHKSTISQTLSSGWTLNIARSGKRRIGSSGDTEFVEAIADPTRERHAELCVSISYSFGLINQRWYDSR
jgi:hypothetical protein